MKDVYFVMDLYMLNQDELCGDGCRRTMPFLLAVPGIAP